VSDRADPPPRDAPDPADAPEQARSHGGLLARHAVDTRPLAVAAYRRLLIGQSTSFVGSMLTQVAVPVQVWALTHSTLDVGYVGLAGLVPIVVFGLYGGAIADAIDRRTLYLWSSTGGWVVTLALLVQTLLDLRDVRLILGLVAVQSAMFAIASSARGAIIPRIVPTDLVPAANSLNFTVGKRRPGRRAAHRRCAHLAPSRVRLRLLRRRAPLHGSPLLRVPAALRPAGRLRATGRSARRRRGADLHHGPTGAPHELRGGHRRHVLAMPRALFPAVADLRFDGNVGPLYAAIAIGAVLVGLSSGWVGRVRRQGRALVVAIIGWGAAVALSGLADQLWLVVAFLALAGAFDLVSAVYRQTILQTYAPDEMRGRMQGVFIAVVAGGPRLGDVRAGATAAATNPTFSWVIGGVVCMAVVAVAGVLVRPFWRYDAAKVLPPP